MTVRVRFVTAKGETVEADGEEGLSLLEAELEQDYEWLKREIQLGIEAGERGEFMWRDEAIESMRAELRRRTGR